MGPRRAQNRAHNGQLESPSRSFESLLNAAEAKQQQAERRSAIPLYDEAIALFEQALALANETSGCVTPDERQNATILLAEAIQNKCELFLKLWEAEGQHQGGTDPLGLLGEYTIEHEAAVLGQAYDMLRTSAMRYKSSSTSPLPTSPSSTSGSPLSRLRVDALVNLGNTLSLLTTVATDPAEIDGMYGESVACYDQALISEDDATTRNNKGDTLVAYAEFLAEHGKGDQAEQTYDAALRAYESAVQLSDSQKGDNLPMLLLDYASAFLSMAEFCFKTQKDGDRALRLLEEAEKRLKLSVSFGRGSPAVHTALGEVYLLVGEIQGNIDVLDAASESFADALRIQRTDVDGLVGAAETAVEKAKITLSAAEAAQLYAQAASFYRSAFGSNKFSGTLRQKSDSLYNYACCLSALALKDETGKDGVAEAKRIVGALIAKGLVTQAEVAADTDLSLCL